MAREILILDDEPRYRRAARYALKDGNYTFFEAETVREGAELIAERLGLRVILLDLQLPGVDGPELLKRLHEQRERFRVIVLTGHEEILDAQEAGELEVFAYHIKGRTIGEQALRFTVEQAFRDIEREQLHKKGRAHLEIAKCIHDLEVEPSKRSEQNLNKVLDLICRKILEVTDSYTCHIRTIDLQRGDFELRACRGPGHFREVASLFDSRKSPGHHFSGAVAADGEPVVENRIQEAEAFKSMKIEIRHSRADVPDLEEYLESIRSAYIIPITTRLFGKNSEGEDRVDAILNISSDRVDFFDEARREIIQEFVNQTGLAITKFWLADKRYEIHQDYKMIGDMLGLITKEVEKAYELEKIFEIVCRKVSDCINPELITLFLLNEDTQLLEVAAEFRSGEFAKDIDGVKEVYEEGQSLTGRVFAERKSLRIPKYPDDTSRPADDPVVRGKSYTTEKLPSGEVRHYLGTPIQIGDQFLGVLRALNKKSRYYEERTPQDDLALLERGFSPDCENILEIAARHLASVIKNSRLIHILKTLNAVGDAIQSEMRVEDLLSSIVRICAEGLRAQICMLFLKNEEDGELTLRKSHPPLPFEGWSYRLDEGATGGVATSGQPRLERLVDASHLGKYDKELDEYIRREHGGNGIETRLMAPIVAKSRVVGVIKLTNKERAGELFGSSDLELLEIVADQIGVAIENAKLYDLRSSYLDNIIENSPDPIIALDPKGKISVFNQAAEQLLGYEPGAVKNASAGTIYESLTEAKRIGGLLRNTSDGRIRDVRARLRHRDGSILPVNLAASLLYSDGGERIGSIGMFKDMRELVSLREEVLQAEKLAAIGSVARSVGHEIKNKIATGLNYIETLLADCDEEANDSIWAYTAIRQSLWDAADKVQSLLLSGLPKSPKRRPVSLRALIDDIESRVRRQTEGQGIEILLERPDLDCVLFVDRDQFRQIFNNLSSNSVLALKEKRIDSIDGWTPHLKLVSVIEESCISMRWSDNGTGIPADIIAKVFTPFYTTREQGSGLGLHIVKEIVEKHGGTVRCHSELGHGAEFEITFPIHQEE